jgi:hypothetical protein
MTLLKLIEQAVRPHFAFVGKPVFIKEELKNTGNPILEDGVVRWKPDYPFQVCASEVNGELEENEQVARHMIVGLADQYGVDRHEVVTELCMEEEQYDSSLQWFRGTIRKAQLDSFYCMKEEQWRSNTPYSTHWRFNNKYVLCKRFLERSIKAQVAKTTNQILNR